MDVATVSADYVTRASKDRFIVSITNHEHGDILSVMLGRGKFCEFIDRLVALRDGKVRRAGFKKDSGNRGRVATPVEFRGTSLTVVQWCERFGIKDEWLRYRIRQYGVTRAMEMLHERESDTAQSMQAGPHNGRGDISEVHPQ